MKRFGNLVRRQFGLEPFAQRRLVERPAPRPTTTAATSSPRSASGMPDDVSGCPPVTLAMACSTSAAETLAPAVLIIALSRPTKYMNPSASARTKSPVWNQPSASKHSSRLRL